MRAAEARGHIENIIAAIDALLPLTSSMAGLSTLCTAQRDERERDERHRDQCKRHERER